jgi:hypothetical protein
MVATGYTSATGDPRKVTGPATATDNAVARYDGVTGKVVQNSTVIVGDDGSVIFSGVVTVNGANFLVSGTNKGYRFRPLGSRLDCEATGSDWQFSVWSGTNYDGAQRSYLRLESGVQLAHAIGKWIWADSPDGAAVHTIDGTAAAPKIGFFSHAPAAQQTVTGGTDTLKIASIIALLQAYGLSA